jgi:hypothetical protein
MYDSEVTEEVREHHHAEPGAGRYNKQIVSRKFLHPVTSQVSAASRAHQVLTLPWLDKGPRALYCPYYEQYTKTMRVCRLNVEAAAKQVASTRGEMMAEARQRLKGMFSDDDYPSVEEIEAKFYVDVEISQMTDVQDFRAELSDEAVKAITKDIQKRSDERLERAVGDVYKRIGTVVGKMAETLKNFEPATGEDKAKNNFKDSLIYNIKDVADLIPCLNITQDPKLDQLGQQMLAELIEYSPEELKTNGKVRAATASKADKIFNKVRKYMN